MGKIFLDDLCELIHLAERSAEEERKLNSSIAGITELLISRRDKIVISMNREPTNHHSPHIHIEHTDKFSASINIDSWQTIASTGSFDKYTKKHLIPKLKECSPELNELWNELQLKDGPVRHQAIINSLSGKIEVIK